MANLHILDHPLIQNKLTRMRDVTTNNHNFRLLLEELTALMVYEITRDYPLREVEVETPLERTTGRVLGVPVVLVPILRAGTGMLRGVLDLLPTAKVGHIGIYRDPKTLQPVQYYAKLPPELPHAQVIIVDPMLATGGSAVAAVDEIKRRGGKKIQFLCLVAAPEGADVLSRAHPEVPIYAAGLDRQLNDHGYILPGLGDGPDFRDLAPSGPLEEGRDLRDVVGHEVGLLFQGGILRIEGDRQPDETHDGDVVQVVPDEADLLKMQPSLPRQRLHRAILCPQLDAQLAPPGEVPVLDLQVVGKREVETQVVPHRVRDQVDPGGEDPQGVASPERADPLAHPLGIGRREDPLRDSSDGNTGEERRVLLHPLRVGVRPRQVLLEQAPRRLAHPGGGGDRPPTRLELNPVIANKGSIEVEDDRPDPPLWQRAHRAKDESGPIPRAASVPSGSSSA